MDLHFQRHAIVPPYTRDLTSKDQFKWSANFEVPVIGDDIVIRCAVALPMCRWNAGAKTLQGKHLAAAHQFRG